MYLYSDERYMEDVCRVSGLDLPWNKLDSRSVLLSGATGLLGSFLVDVLMQKNQSGLNCTVYILGRTENKAKTRFSRWWGDRHLLFIPCDVNKSMKIRSVRSVDYVLHLASNTHPLQYATDPINTIMTNTVGLNHMLDFAVEHHAERFAFASSNEIYGENRGDVELFDEAYCGYIDSNTLRAGYSESKRCGEALCQAYYAQKGLDIVVPRFTRSYGPTMQQTDTKAVSQFIRKAIAGEDIVLKSAGNQFYSYTYVSDAVSGLLFVLLKGGCAQAYNIADEASNITLKELAGFIADHVGKKVLYEAPDNTESAGYSRATKALLDGSKLKGLGWSPTYDIRAGIGRTIEILRATSAACQSVSVGE